MRLLAPLFFLLPAILADVITKIPDAAPPGFDEWESPIVLPAKPVSGDADWASAVARARAFVAQLSLEEKVNLTTGVGTNGRCVGNTGDVTRLGFTGICLQDSPLGVRLTDFVSAFPAGINAAATWDRNLIQQRGAAMGAEHRGKGVNVALGPMTNMMRVPAAGRNWEGFGADPFLSGVATAQTVIGMQGTGVIACVKHYIGNEQEHMRGGTPTYSSNIDDRTMHELYLWPFAEAVQSGVGSVMCSYNQVNQTQTCQNSKILNGLLKEELDFQGFLLSDWTAMINGVQPALAGADMNMPGFMFYGQPSEPNPDNTQFSWWGSALIESVNNGSVPQSRVDDMVTRTMAAYFKMGQDKGYPAINFDYNSQNTDIDGQLVNEHVNVQADHYKLIREIGAASTVLLKNNNAALPLNAQKIKRLALFGSDAGPNPDGPNNCQNGNGDRGCSQGTLAMGWGSGTAQFPYLIDPLSAIQTFMRANNPTTPVEGMLDDYNFGAVDLLASQADVCLAFTNADSGEDYITVDGNEGDRNNLTLWHGGEALIQRTVSSCSNTIVVMHVVGPVLVESWIDHPNVTAVINAGLPGQESGNALVDVLFGAVNPSGRLPYTIAKQRTDYPADILHFDANNITPRFEFGFGLSYTNFVYNGLNIRPGAAKRQEQPVAATPAPVPIATTAAVSSVAATGAKSAPASASTVAVSSAVASVSSDVSLAPASVLSSAPASVLSSVPASAITPPPSVVSSSTIANVSSSIVGNITATGIANVTGTSIIASGTATIPANATLTAPGVISSPIQHSPGGPANLYETITTVTYAITNTGGMDGNEVSQVYLTFPAAANEPPKVLRGFDRTFIRRGQTAFISVPLRRKDVSVWDVVSQQWVIPKGLFTVHVGSSSRAIHLSGTFVP
ncbi:glycoside hydrolase family 3 protein [Sphaerobolus stellatus SS14]|uniref:beta-glucosidase n=1 Tax=Sphaerobolus stellatus (strain SS14) TaxID=990650 RepID=A0A0C9VMQ5_SPHS4|nr:glycoside hydrolase family 3 protein [Sphaerobolus stellatus SS14]